MTIKNIFKILFLIATSDISAQEASLSSTLTNGGSGLAPSSSTVNMSTGVVNTTIPLGTISSNGYTIPISLNYSSGGIRVDQDADWTGLGWNLFYGGSINWNVMGIRDDAPTNVAFESVLSENNGGYFNTKNNPTIVVTEKNRTAVLDNRLDIQPDEFYFSTPRHSGMFVYRKEDFSTYNNTLTPILIPYQPLKIEKTGDYTIGTPFRITDDNGYKYTYDTHQGVTATSKSSESGYVSLPLNLGNDFETTKFLDKIQDYNDITLFTFQYETSNFSTSKTNYSQKCEYRDGANVDEHKTIYSEYRITQNKKTIKKIIYNEGYVIFKKSTLPRLDITNEFSLGEIAFFNNNDVLLKKIKFEYNYFTNSENNNKKLRLNKIWEEDPLGNKSNNYLFEYDERLPINGNDQDHWGFWNGANNTNLIPARAYIGAQYANANRTPNKDYTQALILKKVIMPTGGSKEFAYENNYYWRIFGNATTPDSTIAGGLRIKKIITNDGDNDLSNNTIKYYRYKFELPELSPPFIQPPSNKSSGDLLNYPKYDDQYFAQCDLCNDWNDNNKDHERFVSDGQAQNQSYVAKDGIVAYEVISEYDCDLEAYPQCHTTNGKIVYEYVYAPIVGGNSSRVPNNSYDFFWRRNLLASITTYKGNGAAVKRTKNTYAYEFVNSAWGSKPWIGEIFINEDKSFKKVNTEEIIFISYSYSSEWIKQTEAKQYDLANGESLLTTTNLTYNTSYKKPTEILTTYPDGSATRQKIKYVEDYVTPNSPVPIWGSDRDVINNLKFFNVLGSSIYTTAEFKPAGSTIYKYTDASFIKFGSFGTSHLPKETYSMDLSSPVTSMTIPSFSGDYFVLDAKLKLKSKINSYYTSTNAILPQVIEDENGLKKRVLYNAKLNTPIAEISFQESDFAAFTSYEEGDPSYNENPNNYTFVSLHPSDVTLPDKAVTGDRYLLVNAGNNITYSIPAGEYIFSFWSNADPELGDDNIDFVQTRTGDLDPGSKWQYNEYQIKANGTSNNIYIARFGSTIAIDELRIYPKNATMNSTCYNATGQVVSTCDINNNIVHTQYDSFNRIKCTKDRNGNIIKKYNYDKGDSDLFFNDYLYKTFLKTDCPTGTWPQSTDQPYPIPVHVLPGMISSEISKEDANFITAEYMKNEGQTIANNEIGCSPCIGLMWKVIDGFCHHGQTQSAGVECCGPGMEREKRFYSFPDNTNSDFYYGLCHSSLNCD
jgi:Family of unknown function (DUF5977)